MVTFDTRFHLKKGTGLVRDIFNEKNMARLTGNIGIEHVPEPATAALLLGGLSLFAAARRRGVRR